MSPRYISVADAAAQWSCTQKTIRKLIAEGRLTGYHVGRVLRVDPLELEEAFRGPGKKYGPPRPADVVSGWMAKRGIHLDPLRLEETAAAEQSRNRREFAEFSDAVKARAELVKRSQRMVEIEEFAHRQSPSADSQQRAEAARQSRRRAEADLLEAVHGDQSLFRAVLRRA